MKKYTLILLVCLFTLPVISVFTNYALANPLKNIMLMEQYEKEKNRETFNQQNELQLK